LLPLALLTTAQSLCAQVTMPWFNGKPRRPDRMAVFWTDTVLNQPPFPGVRGFGGRVLFFVSDSDKPVKVDGSLTVFAYDDSDQDMTQTVPDRKFIFTAEQLPRHYSKSKLGHSYSFWIPWDAVGGPQRTISLVCRFEPREGGMIVSESLREILPGSAPLKKQATARANPGGLPMMDPAGGQAVQPASYAQGLPEAAGAPARPRLEATTIDLPPNCRLRRLSEDRSATYRPRTNMRPDRDQPLARMEIIENPRAPVSGAGDWPPDNGYQVANDPVAQIPPQAAGPTVPVPARQVAPPTRPASDSRRPTPRVLGEPIARPRPDRIQMRPHPPGWPSDLRLPPATVQPGDPPTPAKDALSGPPPASP
jgi:hypothetical protein